LPAQGAQWERPFKVGKIAVTALRNQGDRALPIAHTCFFQIELPEYTTAKIMREKLLTAMHGSVGVIAMA